MIPEIFHTTFHACTSTNLKAELVSQILPRHENYSQKTSCSIWLDELSGKTPFMLLLLTSSRDFIPLTRTYNPATVPLAHSIKQILCTVDQSLPHVNVVTGNITSNPRAGAIALD